MRTIILSISLVFTCYIGFTQSGSISLPEFAVFYTNYENKIIPTIPCGDSMIINIEGGTISPYSWEEEDKTLKGYIVKVLPDARIVTIELFGVNENKVKNSYGVYKYRVKPFPSPEVMTFSISKSMGTKVYVSLGANSPITNIQFQVTGGEVIVGKKVHSFTGDRIPPEILSECKVGHRISINVFYTMKGEKQNPISAILKVVY